MSTDAAIVTGVRSLWEQGHFQDFTIQVADRCFKVNKLTMASTSDYFRAMLTSGMEESTKDTVKVGVVSALAMDKLVSFIYRDKMDLTNDNVTEILDAAMYLQIPTAVKVCVDFIIKNVNPKDCYSFISVLRQYSLSAGVRKVRAYIRSNVKHILSECNGDHIPYEEFCFLIDNWQGSEMDLFPYVRKWAEAEYLNRKQHVNDLLSKIRFCLMSPEELESIQHTKLYQTCLGSWQELVHEAVEYHRLPLHARVLHDSEQSTLRSKPRLSCLYMDDSHFKATTLKENKQSPWESLELSIPDDCGLSKASVCVNNFLIISPYGHGEGNWYLFDPRTVSWFELPPSNIWNEDNFAAVYHQGYLYVLGGSYYQHHFPHDHVERYDFQTNQWSLLTRLPDPRNKHAVCTFQDCIYVSGGRHQTFGANLRKVDCLNPSTLVWESKAPMLKEAEQHLMCVMKLHGQDVILVVHEDFMFEYYNASTDQWTKFPFTHEQFPHCLANGSSPCALITKGNTLYFLDDQYDGDWNNEGQCLEITFPEKGTQVSVTSFEHFETDMDYRDYHFYTQGAVLSLPEHKLPGLCNKSS